MSDDKLISGFSIEYDGSEGTVEMINMGIKDIIEVRKGIVDRFIRQAAIVELERLGYTVLSPDGEE